MRIIDFIFELLTKFVPMKEKDASELRGEAKDWYYTKIVPSDNENLELEPTNNPVVKIMRQYSEEWYVRLGLAVLFIPAVIWLRDLMQGSTPEEDDDDDY